ncbi:uncharacterized protein VTP21DRAFT_9492 [Calcarisporiella thermophila]|uniref:uncharacterized protein n=1 Tax=Calcarisporiella thermophila TaxID=911321 RepID=UPI0037424E53
MSQANANSSESSAIAKWWQDVCRSLTFPICMRTIKATVALVISTIIAYLPWTARTSKLYSAMPVGTMICFIGDSFGVQLVILIISLFSIGLGLAFSAAGMAAVTKFNSYNIRKGNQGGRGIAIAFLAVIIFFSNYLKAYGREYTPIFGTLVWYSANSRWSIAQYRVISILVILMAIPMFIASIDVPSFGRVTFLFGYAAYPILIGYGVGVAVNWLILPESATKKLGQDFILFFDELEKLFKHTTHSFLLNDNPSQGPEWREISSSLSRLRGKLSIMKQSYLMAKPEISLGYLHSTDYAIFIKPVEFLCNHGASLALTIENKGILMGTRQTNARRHSQTMHLSRNSTENAAPISDTSNPAQLVFRRPLINQAGFPDFAFGDNFQEVLSMVRVPIEELAVACCDSMYQLKMRLCIDYKLEDPRKFVRSLTEQEKATINTSIWSTLAFWKPKAPLNSLPNPNIQNCYRQLKNAITQFDAQEAEALRIYEGIKFGQNVEVLLIFFYMASMRELARDLLEVVKGIERLQKSRGTRYSPSPLDNVENGLGAGSVAPTKQPKKRLFFPGFSGVRLDGSEARVYDDYTFFSQQQGSEKSENSLGETPTRNVQSTKPTFRERLVAFGRFLRSRDFLFAIKCTVGSLALLCPGFINSSRGWYNYYHGIWAVFAYVVVLTSPYMGDTMLGGIGRILATLLGCVWAMVTFYAGNGSPAVNLVLGLVLMIPVNFYGVQNMQYASYQILALATFTGVILTQHHQPYPEGVWLMALIRAGVYAIGIVAGYIVNTLWWPCYSREELRKLLGQHLIDLGSFYSTYVLNFMYGEIKLESTETEKEIFRQLQNVSQARMLLGMSAFEPRIKGHFPSETYQEIINLSQDILDRFVSIHRVSESVHPLIPTTSFEIVNPYRRNLNYAVILSFHILGTSLKTKTPLPPIFPFARVYLYHILQGTRKLDCQAPPDTFYRRLFWYACGASIGIILDRVESLHEIVKTLMGENELIKASHEPFNPVIGTQKKREHKEEPSQDEQVSNSEGSPKRKSLTRKLTLGNDYRVTTLIEELQTDLERILHEEL